MTRERKGRMRRVDEAVKQVLSEEIPRLKDPRIGFVTVTGVLITQDIEHADVWISVYGTDKQRKGTMDALERAKGVLQASVNRQLRLRRTPVIRFQYDAAIERGVRMTALIDELTPPDEEAPAEEETRGDDRA
jgi:ribosome-binding factor A